MLQNDDRREGVRRLLDDVVRFTAIAGTQPLRPYQAEAARAVVESVRAGRGDVITVMMARQMGKNQTSAALEHYLLNLFAGRGGQIVKAAPTFAPQLITSKQRLERELTSPLSSKRWKPERGYALRLGDARILFFSSHPTSNVVGATADILLEIDEAQDVDGDKYRRDFRPMAATANATTVLYGTAWTEDCLLERQRRENVERQARLGRRLHFEYDWTHLASLSPAYRRFVEGEIARLGADHPIVSTQYRLQPLAGLGRLFSPAQQALLRGRHDRRSAPASGEQYVAGVDIAGEDAAGADGALRALKPRRDSTVVTIGRVRYDDDREPVVEVVEHQRWTGHDHKTQLAALRHLLRDVWDCRRVAVDATGIGAGIASWLASEMGAAIEQVVFTAPLKSRLAYTLLGMVNTGRLRLYVPDSSAEARDCWAEVAAARYETRAGEQITFYVPIEEGHDDFVISLALCAHAASSMLPPAAHAVVSPRHVFYGDETAPVRLRT